MLVSDFHYDLPEELIAQGPLPDRAGSRLLHLNCTSVDSHNCDLSDVQFRDFPGLLRPSDLVVFNNTRVFPARLYGRRGGLRSQPVSGRNPAARDYLRGRIEVLLIRQLQREPNEWECLVRPGRKIAVGEALFFGEHNELEAEVIARAGFGERRIRFASSADFFGILEKIGHVPLPPYISREDSASDRERYQTVYGSERGSVAAPTAGLHFTNEILAGMRDRGIETTEVTLHVGLGTFQPVRSKIVEEHQLHSEAYSISAEAAEKINRARAQSRRIVAVGTTTVRTLEYAAQQGDGEISASSGEANLFIYPGYKFQVVQALLTNFHLPQSTLLMLVCALGGKDNVMRAYRHAVAQRYRFYSYGDCMLLESWH
ncbi:MAG TPA: tRNA preQ1(34) S-adenosylmethionine ribosyltransferase-isomerase QueA [Candidatus Sulfotelmatobacter sp.]|nr:tRNA preQ1(34) S-adenosylmethionine ribosyltransferase-isomerase QueA [Candidatus Sulfotelmatobacter sp.]